MVPSAPKVSLVHRLRLTDGDIKILLAARNDHIPFGEGDSTLARVTRRGTKALVSGSPNAMAPGLRNRP